MAACELTMRPLHLDFLRDRPPLPVTSVVLLIVGIAAIVAASTHVAVTRRQVDGVSAALEQATARSRAVPQSSPVDAAASARDGAEAAQVAAALNLDWPALFHQLERVRVAGVTLLAIQPETSSAGRRLRISGEARRLDAALAYVSQLAAMRGFANGHLASHEVLADQGGNVVQFVAVVDWMAPP